VEDDVVAPDGWPVHDVRTDRTRLRCAGGREIGRQMEQEEVSRIITDYIVRDFLFGDESRMPREDESLLEHGIIDSTGILELIEFLESEFGIAVTEAETLPKNLGSAANLTRFVMAKRTAG
jgi:acyl carrier protein